MSTWVNEISFIEDMVDYVRADDTNRPLQELDSRTQYLYDAIQAQSLGELILARNVTLSGVLPPGTPVYFDTSDSLWKPAEAILDIQEGNDFGFAAPESEVKGLVLVNHLGTGNTADVALYGRIRSDWGIQWDQVVDVENEDPGRYYLSVTPGKITLSRNVLSVEIGTLAADGSMVFTPDITGNLRSHLHLRFELEAVQAANLSEPGWADESLFPNAPAGAVYGYNLSQNPELSAKFPPTPFDNYFLTYNGVGLARDTVVVDANGIWWMDASDAPFSLGDHVYTDTVDHYFEFWMMQLNFGAKIVNSLRSGDVVDTLPVQVRALDGTPMDNGDLQVFLANSVLPDGDNDEGALAYKTINGVKAKRGPVVSRVVAGPGVTVSGASGNATDGFYGAIAISSTAALTSVLNSSPTLVALRNAREDFYNRNVPVLNLPRNRISSFKLKIPVAPFLPTNLGVTLRLGVLSASLFSTTVQIGVMVVSPGVDVPGAPTTGPDVPVSILAGEQNRLKLITTPVLATVQPGDVVLIDVGKDPAIANDIMFASIDYNLAVS